MISTNTQGVKLNWDAPYISDKESKEKLFRILTKYLEGDNIFTSPYLKERRNEMIQELIEWKDAR